MKLLLVLVAAFCISTAFSKEVGKTRWSYVFTELAKPPTGENEEAANNALVDAVGGVLMTCEPGWTGENCQNPICPTRNPAVGAPILNIYGMLVDQTYLANCRGSLQFPHDSLSTYSYIAVSSDGGSPRIVFTDSNGTVYEGADANIGVTFHHAFYRNIPPGPYTVTITLTAGPATFCVIEARAYTQTSIRIGFVTTPQDDFPTVQSYPTGGIPSYFIVHGFNIPFPGSLSTVSIVADGASSVTYRGPLNKRYACAYERFVGTFTCDPASTYVVKIDGIDYNGYPLRRATPIGCLLGTTTQAPSTTSPPIISQCQNGGTILNFNTTDASCFCPVLFTGPTCGQPLCMNGAASNALGDGCVCLDGFSGTSCQDVNCTFPSGNGFLTDSKTLIFVVRSSSSMAGNIAEIARAIQNVVNTYNVIDQNVYRGYELVSFVNGTVQVQFFFVNQFDQFKAALMALGTQTSPGDCTDTVMNAVSAAFDSAIILNKSPIYVFTDAYANDYSAFRTILNKNANRKYPVHFFIITPSAASGCVNDPLHPGNREMQRVAAFTQGLSMSVDASTPTLGDLIYTIILGTTYKVNYVLMNDLQVCSRGPAFQTFAVDSSVTNIHVLATGVNMQLGLIDPLGASVEPPIQMQINNTFTWHIPNPLVGQYMLQISSGNNGPCSFRVLVRGEYNFFYSASPGIIVDAGFSEPVFGVGRHIVAAFNGQPIIDPYRQFAEITIYGNGENDARQSLYMSNGVYRDGCDYKMYFGAYNCRQPDQLLYITVYADDNNGDTIQRSAVGYCSAIEPTNQPPGSCLNGGVANPTNSTPCLCPPQFSGDYCQTIICQNGGTGTTGICSCPPGTRGQFCEINTCPVQSTGINFDPNGRSLIFALSVRASMQPILTAIAANAGEMVRDLQIGSPNWIKNYMVIIFNQTMVMTLKNNSDPQSFVSGLGAAATYPAMSDGTFPNCTVKLQSALLLALQNSYKNSYIFVFTDSNGQDELLSGSLLSGTENSLAMINMITTATPICGASASGSGITPAVETIIAFSGGDFYNTDDAGNFMKFVPQFFESGLVYVNYQDDCVTKNMTIYFPIDGWTQSFTTAIYGATPTLTMAQPDGSSTINLDVPLINPSVSAPNLLLRQTIIPCTNGFWHAEGQYCYKFDPFARRNWTSTRDFCHGREAEGFVVDVHSNTTQAFLDIQTGYFDYWIGLNSLAQLGQWEWDVPDGAAYSHLDPLGYLNWAPGEPTIDPNLRCVLVKHIGTNNMGQWYASDCAIMNLTVCQKHKYGQGISPGEQNVNLLPQGMWRADISTTSGFCYVQVRAQSRIQPYYGFVQDIHNDFPDPYGLFNSQSNRIAASVSGLDPFNSNSPGGSVNYAFMYKTNFTMNRAVTFERRDQCTYKFVSQQFSCPGQNIPNTIIDDFFIKFSGVDQYGNLFERYTPAFCVAQVFLPCRNGGTQYQGTCVCRPFFTGPLCDIRLCQNGGVQINAGTACNCQAAYTGGSCEFPMCIPPYPSNFNNNGKTLAIVLETSYRTGQAVFRLQRNIDTILNQVLSGSTATWFSNFILFPFDSVDNMAYWFTPNVYTTVASLKAGLGAITPGRCPGPNGTVVQCSTITNSCPRPIMAALNATLNFPQLAIPNSQVLLITQSSAEDYTVANQVLDRIQQTGVVVSVLVTDTLSPCSMGFNSSEGRAMFELAGFSGGSVFQLSSTELAGTFTTTYLPTLYSAAVISGGFSRVCTGQVSYVQVDDNMTDFTLDIFGANLQVTLRGPTGPVNLPGSLLTSSYNYFQVVAATLLQGPGIYTVNVTAVGSECGVQVRGRSTIETFIGYTQVTDQYNGATQDDSHYAPLGGQNQQNIILVHANGLSRGRMTYVEMAGPDGLLFTSPLERRAQNCSYQYYSTKSFLCNSRTFLVALHGWDEFGVNFRRLAIGHCVDTRPIQPPPPATCNLRQKKLDLVFVLDSSMIMGNDSFQAVKTFLKTLLIPYNISQSATQFGLMTLAAMPNGQFQLKDSPTMSRPNLIDPVPYDGSNGQNMTGALNLLISTFSDPANGYRTDPDTQHLVIYITRNAGFTGGDPYEIANTIRRGGSWGISTLAYGILQGGSSNNLMQLSGGRRCYYHAGNPTDLNTNGLNFIQTTTCFDGHLCQF